MPFRGFVFNKQYKQKLLDESDRENKLESDASDFHYLITDNEVAITGYKGGGVANIPSGINGDPVISINDNAFSGCTNLWRIAIPDSVGEEVERLRRLEV